MREVPQHVIESGPCGILEKIVAGDLPCLDQRNPDLRLIVKHLFEMRDMPGRVHRIAVEAASELVAHAAARHCAQRVEGHLPGELVPAQQKIQNRRPRDFRGVAEAPALGVKDPREGRMAGRDP